MLGEDDNALKRVFTLCGLISVFGVATTYQLTRNKQFMNEDNKDKFALENLNINSELEQLN